MLEDLPRWSATADTKDFWIWVGASSAIALGFLVASFWSLRRARLIEDTPTSRIRSAAQGYVEVEGIGLMMDGPETVGPLTTAFCVWWEYRIERKTTTGSGKNRTTEWRTIASGTSSSLFVVDDETGKCVIDPAGAKVLTVERDLWYGSTSTWSGPPATGWWRQLFFRYRYMERRLAAYEPIYALGWFKTVREEQLTGALQPDVNVLCKPPRHDGRLFMLSAISQGKLTWKFRGRAAFWIIASMAFGLFAAYMVSARFAAGV